MAGNIKEDLKQIKLFKDSYKKCNVVSAKDAKEVEALAKKIKYFGYDMRQGLAALEEMVAEKKTDPEVIKGKAIEDYEVYRDIRAMLKDVKYNLKKVVEASKDLEKVEKNANIKASQKKLEFLLKSIILDTKMRKGGKPEKVVVKLQKQIEADLKIMDNFYSDIKKILPRYPNLPDYSKEFKRETDNIAKAKPRLSSRTKKYMKLAPQMLEKNALKKQLTICEKAKKELDDVAKAVTKAINEKDKNTLLKKMVEGDRKLILIENIDEKYTKIRKKYDKEIDNSNNKKAIHKATDAIAKIQDEADTAWHNSKSEIGDYFKQQKKEAKKG